MRYDNIYELLHAMQFSGEKDIISADTPKQMLLGWYSPKTNTYWEISVIKCRHSFYNKTKHNIFSKEDNEKIKEYICASSTRNNIVQLLVSLEKYYKLKAFW